MPRSSGGRGALPKPEEGRGFSEDRSAMAWLSLRIVDDLTLHQRIKGSRTARRGDRTVTTLPNVFAPVFPNTARFLHLSQDRAKACSVRASVPASPSLHPPKGKLMYRFEHPFPSRLFPIRIFPRCRGAELLP